MQSSRRYLIAFFVLTVVLIGGFFWYKHYSFEKEKEQAIQAHRNGDVTYSIPALEELISQTRGEDAAYLKMRLAADLFTRNGNGDRTASAEIYKALVADETMPPRVRAIAIDELISIYEITNDAAFAREVIFTDSPLEQFYENNDLQLAIRQSYEMANSLYPLPSSTFHIAFWYGAQLAANPNSTERAEYKDQLKSWTKKGEDLIPKAEQEGFEPTRLAAMYLANAIARDYMAFADSNHLADQQHHIIKSEKAFKQALESLGAADTFYTYQMSQYVRFQYAVMIARNSRGRAEHVQAILEPVVNKPVVFQGKETFFEAFAKREVANPDSRPRLALLLLARIYPDFSNIWK